MSPTGRYVSIPNRSIFNKPVYNYNRKDPFVMQDVYILIDADSDRQKALEIAGKIAYERYTKMIENYDEVGKNKMIMENALFDALKAHGFKMPGPKYIRIQK